MKKILITLLIIFLLLFALPQFSILAQAPYITQSPNRYGEFVVTQDAYEPIQDIRSFENQLTFSNPRDIFVDHLDYLYVLDSGNRRVVIFDENHLYLTHFGADLLVRPTGIFVRNNKIYIADYGTPEDVTSGRIHIYLFNRELNQVNLSDSFQRPASPVLEINQFIYRPQKIAVDYNETMYVVSEGSYNGILMINSENRFLSFFAPNRVQGTLLDRVIQVLYGNNERAQLTKKIPPAPSNVFLDDSGYVFTVTQTTITGSRGDTLKKVNNGGLNFFPDNMFTASDFTSIAVGQVDNVYAITRSGFIYEYDREGNLMFVFAGSSQGQDRIGLFQNASAIAVNSQNYIIVADEVSNNIHIFKPTAFANVVHEALGLYNQGKYVESQSLWEEVLRYNALFDLAHEGIGLSYLMQGQYKEALNKFEIANAQEEYSLAYWEVRNDWLMSNAGFYMVGIIILYLGLVVIKKVDTNDVVFKPTKKLINHMGKYRFVQEISFMTRFIKNPADAVYEVKTHKRVSFYSGLIYALGLVVLYILHLLFTGFLFTPIILERADFLEELLKILAPFITFVFANYLISSLMEGEGTFKAIFINTCGALIPVYLILPILIILSNVLTYNEQFIYQFGLTIMIGWSAVLVFFIIKDTHNYTIKETIYNLIMTILMMVVMIILVIMVYMMMMQVVEFVADLFKEVIINA
jgi:tetratricopeptide (TPR) repeat protein